MSDSFRPDFATIGKPAPTWNAKRPLRIAILGDFGAGAGRGRLDDSGALAKRKPMKVEFDTLDDVMRRLQVSLTLPLGADGAPVEIELGELEAFHPDTIYGNVPLFSELSSLRKRLNNTSTFAAASKEVMKWADGAGPRASTLARKARARGEKPARGAKLGDFARLTGRASTSAKGEGAIDGLLQRVVGPFVHKAANPNKDALVAAVDSGLSDAMRALLHHPDFQTTESLWRGVDFVLRKLETSHSLQVHLVDISAEEFAADLAGSADLANTGLYRLLVDTPSQEADGGYRYIAACYQFDATPPHAELLGRAAQVASHAGASLLTGIAIDPFSDRREPPHPLVRDAFAAMRSLPAASFLGLVGPRFLLRHPYGKKSDPISSFAFEEFSLEAGLRGMLWGHPALLALAVLARPGAPLVVDDLAFHHYVDEHGDSVALPCTDRFVSANVASLLGGFGINAVMAHKGEALVKFNGLDAVNGDGLAASGAGARKRPSSELRFSARPDDAAHAARERREEEERLARKRKRAAASAEETTDEAPAAASADDSSDGSAHAFAESSADDSGSSGEASGWSSEASGSDSPVETGASADEPAAASDEAPATSAGDDLDALLASLDDGATKAEGDGGVEAKEGEAEDEQAIDPDLAALLKSLG